MRHCLVSPTQVDRTRVGLLTGRSGRCGHSRPDVPASLCCFVDRKYTSKGRPASGAIDDKKQT
jgi:hypothetical protein